MKHRLRKLTSALISIVMIFGVLTVAPFTVSAANTSDSLVAIAEGELGNTNYSKYYGGNAGAWCADFVTWCAQQAGVSSITNSSSCYYMYRGMVEDNHCQVVSSPQKGDIVFFYCNSCSGTANKWCHVGIMVNSTTSIDGNYGGKVSYDSSYSHYGSLGYKHSSGISKIYVRPNYENGNITAFGYDCPTDNQTISDKTFVFQGWVTTTKSVSSITCSINDGQKYFTASLYTRPDVPSATAFRTEIPTINLNMGNNKVAVCVNYTDGTGDVAGYRTVTRTRPDYTYGYDNPVEGEHINDSTFLFQGWIDADKEIEKITCSINDGERYFEAGLYTRPDVPNAVAFRREIYSDYLNYGENHISVCLTYADGTSVTVARKTIYRTYVAALDNPIDSEFILDDKFLFQGWVESEKEIKNIKCLINGETYLNTALYTRPDVPYATAYRLEAKRSYLDYGKNTIEVYVEYEDGTNMKLLKRNIYNFEKLDLGTDFEAYIEHIESQKVLSVDNEDNVIIKTNSESDNQIWTFSKNSNGSYTIISKSNNKCLDNYAASGTSKSNVQVYEQNNTNAQQWYVLKGTTSYYLMPVCSNKCCIDLAQNDATDGTNVRLYDFNDTYAQKYNIVKTSFEIGDVNGDENINITDTTSIQKYIASINTLDENALIRADVNSDSSVDIKDATLIQQYCAGLIDKF